MKKVVFPTIAILLLGGCAASQVRESDMALERLSKEQTVRHNEIVLDRDCAIADAAAVAQAMAKAGISFGEKMTPARERVFMYHYEDLRPACVEGKRSAAPVGGRYGVTPRELVRAEQSFVCVRSNILYQTILSKEVARVAGEGSTVFHLREMIKFCDWWRQESRIDYAVEQHYKPRWIAPHPLLYGYRSYPYYQPGGPGTCPAPVCVGVILERRGNAAYSGAPGRSRQKLWRDLGLDSRGQYRNRGKLYYRY